MSSVISAMGEPFPSMSAAKRGAAHETHDSGGLKVGA
jgi:hypothetical protein